MRIVADTNVLVSATFWRGDSDRIMCEVEKGNVTLVLSLEIVREFLEVLRTDEMLQKIREKELRFQRTIEKTVSLAEIVYPNQKLNIIKDDPDDNKILECALDGNANLIVTQDKHLLKLGKFEGIRIVTPKQALKEV